MVTFRISAFPFLLLACIAFFSGCATKRDRPVVIRSAEKRSLPILRSQVEFNTNHGSFVLLLFHNEAPVTVENFRTYVKDGFYEESLFHRVIPDFMIQGGGLTRINGNLVEKDTREAIRNEAANGLKNKRGAVAMARLDDRDSGAAQFFINLKDNPDLDHGQTGYGYAVFGRVIEGMDVVDRIAQQPTRDTRRFIGLPQEDVVILSARTLSKDEFVDYGPDEDSAQKKKNERKKVRFGPIVF